MAIQRKLEPYDRSLLSAFAWFLLLAVISFAARNYVQTEYCSAVNGVKPINIGLTQACIDNVTIFSNDVLIGTLIGIAISTISVFFGRNQRPIAAGSFTVLVAHLSQTIFGMLTPGGSAINLSTFLVSMLALLVYFSAEYIEEKEVPTLPRKRRRPLAPRIKQFTRRFFLRFFKFDIILSAIVLFFVLAAAYTAFAPQKRTDGYIFRESEKNINWQVELFFTTNDAFSARNNLAVTAIAVPDNVTTLTNINAVFLYLPTAIDAASYTNLHAPINASTIFLDKIHEGIYYKEFSIVYQTTGIKTAGFTGQYTPDFGNLKTSQIIEISPEDTKQNYLIERDTQAFGYAATGFAIGALHPFLERVSTSLNLRRGNTNSKAQDNQDDSNPKNGEKQITQ